MPITGAQYIRADKGESRPGGYDAYFPPKAGNLPTDGKWYLDALSQVASPFKNKYPNQDMDENHQMRDLPGFMYGTSFVQGSFMLVRRGNDKFLTWKLQESAQQVLDKRIDAARTKMGGVNFVASYAQAFQSYLAKNPDTPQGYVTWRWLAQVDTTARTLKITIDQQPTWHNGTDATVWDKVGLPTG
jgi:hypothetical protein